MSIDRISQDELCLMDVQKYIKDKLNSTELDSGTVDFLKSVRKKVKSKIFDIRKNEVTNPFVLFEFEYINHTTFKIKATSSISGKVINTKICTYADYIEGTNFILKTLQTEFDSTALKDGQVRTYVFGQIKSMENKTNTSVEYKVYKNEVK